MKNTNCTKTFLILVFGFYFSSSVTGQIAVKNNRAYQDSLRNEWWFPLVEKQGIELTDFLVYDKAPQLGNFFINGKLETKNDTLTIFKNGIAFGKPKDKYIIYYFDSFKIEPNDFEVKYEKYEYFSKDSILLLHTEQHEGEFFIMRTDKKTGSLIMQTLRKP